MSFSILVFTLQTDTKTEESSESYSCFLNLAGTQQSMNRSGLQPLPSEYDHLLVWAPLNQQAAPREMSLSSLCYLSISLVKGTLLTAFCFILHYLTCLGFQTVPDLCWPASHYMLAQVICAFLSLIANRTLLSERIFKVGLTSCFYDLYPGNTLCSWGYCLWFSLAPLFNGRHFEVLLSPKVQTISLHQH
jgi:hypothetical protein